MAEILPQNKKIIPRRNKHCGNTIPQRSLTEFENYRTGRKTVAGMVKK
jgi:hypothetical protein